MNDLIIRAPRADEMTRAVYLFRNCLLRPQSHLLAALRTQPVERFVAAAAWWIEGTFGRFQLVGQPGPPHFHTFELLIRQVLRAARDAGAQALHYADLLGEQDEWCEVLRKTGFGPLRPNRFFEVRYRNAWIRVMRMVNRYQAAIPPDWRTEYIRQHSPGLASDLIGRYGLLPPTELRYYWQAGSPVSFDLDASSFLFEGSRPVGVLLARRGKGVFFVDVRVVQLENRRLRALGNILLFRHMAELCGPAEDIHRLQFHGGEVEHRETANLAFRMGGCELPPRYIFSKPL